MNFSVNKKFVSKQRKFAFRNKVTNNQKNLFHGNLKNYSQLVGIAELHQDFMFRFDRSNIT